MCTGRDPGVQGNPADVPAHDFGDHAPVMGIASRTKRPIASVAISTAVSNPKV